MTIVRNNPFEGMTVRGVRDSFDQRPLTSAAALAVFGGALYWAAKSAKKSGPIGTAIKGMIALAIMKKAKNTLMAQSRNPLSRDRKGAVSLETPA